MMGLLFRQALGRILGSPARLALIASYAALIAWAGVDGVRWKSEVVRLQEDRPADLFTDRAEWMAQLEGVESGEDDSPFAARPMRLTLLAVLPPGPLSQLAHRHESIYPHTALLSGFRNEASLFQRYEVEGPAPLAVGSADLGYIVVVLCPLLLLMLTFDALSGERETGRMRLFVVQGGRPPALLAVRVLAAMLLLWGISILGVLVASVAGTDVVENGRRLSLAVAALTAYVVFWAALCAWVATWFSRTVDTALAALATWVAIVLLLPSLTEFAAEAVFPLPSRVATLTQARAAEGEARRHLEERSEAYLAEHGTASGASDDAVPGFFRSSYLSSIEINDRTSPIIAHHEASRSAQLAVADRIQILSPPMLTHRILHVAVGAGAERAAAYRRQTRSHLGVLLDAIGPATVGKARLTSSEARAIPDFQFVEPEVPDTLWLHVLWLLALSGAVGLPAMGAARRVGMR